MHFLLSTNTVKELKEKDKPDAKSLKG